MIRTNLCYIGLNHRRDCHALAFGDNITNKCPLGLSIFYRLRSELLTVVFRKGTEFAYETGSRYVAHLGIHEGLLIEAGFEIVLDGIAIAYGTGLGCAPAVGDGSGGVLQDEDRTVLDAVEVLYPPDLAGLGCAPAGPVGEVLGAVVLVKVVGHNYVNSTHSQSTEF